MGARRVALCVGALLACRSAPAPASRETATTTPRSTAQDRATASIDREPAPAVEPTDPVGPTESELAPPPAEAAPAPGPSDDELRAHLVEASIAEYEGNCPCPYHTMSNGRRCGARSAYSRGGGDAPLCYAHDVTPEMIQQQRATVQ